MASRTGPDEADGARAWRCADLGGLELFRASVRQFAFRPHAHGEFFVAITETGLAAPRYRGDRHLVGPGDMIVLNPEEAHAAENVTLTDLARHAGLAPSYLCRVFLHATGMTPHGYQVQVRVRRARTLLLAGRPIAEAAAEAGFWDQAHLTRHFKRTMGLSPGRYVADVSTCAG